MGFYHETAVGVLTGTSAVNAEFLTPAANPHPRHCFRGVQPRGGIS
jgi:hypothetical protein